MVDWLILSPYLRINVRIVEKSLKTTPPFYITIANVNNSFHNNLLPQDCVQKNFFKFSLNPSNNQKSVSM